MLEDKQSIMGHACIAKQCLMMTSREQVLLLPVKRRGDWISSELIIAAELLPKSFFVAAVNFSFDSFQARFRSQDLIKDLHSELSGDFRKLVMATLKSPAEFDAYELNSAIKVTYCIIKYH